MCCYSMDDVPTGRIVILKKKSKFTIHLLSGQVDSFDILKQTTFLKARRYFLKTL